MAYNPAIPQGSDLISASSTPIRGNFSSANTAFGVDHQPFTEGGAGVQGTHKKISFTGQPSPIPTTSGSNTAVYPNSSNQLIFKNSSGAEQISGTTATLNQNGALALPIGIKFRWGFVTGAGSSGSVTFSTSPFSTACYSVVAVPESLTAASQMSVNTITPSGFSYNAVNTTAFYYIAIGN